jgi:hypothetical protein
MYFEPSVADEKFHLSSRIRPSAPVRKPRKKSLKKAPLPTSLKTFILRNQKTGHELADLNYDASPDTTTLGYMHLIKKYKSRCFFSGKLTVDSSMNLKYLIDNQLFVQALNIGPDLLECAENETSVIFIPLSLPGHANMLLYRPSQKVVERFEPHGDTRTELNPTLKSFFEETLKPVLGPYTPQFKYPQFEINKLLKKMELPALSGLQLLEHRAQAKVKEEGEGYCQVWSLFFMECILLKPKMTTKDVIQEIYRVSKSDPQFLRELMRGYVENLSKEMERSLGLQANLKNKIPLKTYSDAQYTKNRKVMQNTSNLAALYKKRHKRTQKNSGSASSHSSDFNDSSGLSAASEQEVAESNGVNSSGSNPIDFNQEVSPSNLG